MSSSRLHRPGLVVGALLLLAAGCEPGVTFEKTDRADRFGHGVRLQTRCKGVDSLSNDDTAASADGKWIARTHGLRGVEVIDARTCKVRATLEVFEGAPDAYLEPIALSADGTYLALGQQGSNYNRTPRLLELWEVATRKRVARFAGHPDNIEAVAVSPRGRWLASIDKRHTLKIWRARSGRLAHSGHLDPVVFGLPSRGWMPEYPGLLAFSPDGKLLAVGSSDEAIKLFEVKSGALRAYLERPVVEVRASSLAFSPDGKLLAAGWVDDHFTLFQVSPPGLVRDLALGQAYQRKHWVGGTLDQLARLLSNEWRVISAVGFDRATGRIWARRSAGHLVWIEPTWPSPI